MLRQKSVTTCALEHFVHATCKLSHLVLPEKIEDVYILERQNCV